MFSCSSMPPSCLASSTMDSNSSSVIPLSAPGLMTRDKSFFHCLNRKLNGVSKTIRRFKSGAENMANFSGDSFAMLLGDTSPKISTTIVVTAVDMPALLLPFSAIFLILILFKDENAVSVAEKYADITMPAIMIISEIV